ncbi:MAG: pentapeptide repeat-containing protein [Cyanobacteria bacterium P01_D01_bin.50]
MTKKYSVRNSNQTDKNLQGSSYTGNNLEGYNFESANIQGVDFTGANLKNANFKGAIAENTNFEKADIRGVDFTGANLINANFKSTVAGLVPNWTISFLSILFVLASLSVICLVIAGQLAGDRIIPNHNPGIYPDNYWEELWLAVIIILIFSIFLVNVIKNKLATAFQITLIAGIIIISYRFVNALVLLILRVEFRTINVSLTSSVQATVVGFGIGALAVAIAITISIAKIIGGKIAHVIVLLGTIIATLLTTIFLSQTGAHIISVTIGGCLASLGIILGNYIAICTFSKERKYPLVWNIAIFLAAIGGTNFQKANLTDADFARATVKCTDFRGARLIRTFWYRAKQIDFIRAGNSYLENLQVRQLVSTGEGSDRNFERLDLRGINLQGANLVKANFIDADFYQANLQGANLSGAKLIRTNFERADLTGTNLTGSCIQDWVITSSTKLEQIICDHVFLKWEDQDKRDQIPPRGKFKEGGFVTFIRHILDTVELYHNKDINPRLALNVLQKMSRDYDEPLDIVALGKKGDKIFIQVKVSENIQREKLRDDYYSRYDEDLKLWSGNIHNLPPTVNSFIEKRINEIASEKTDDFVFVDATYIDGNYTQNYQGEINMTGERNIQANRDYRETHINDRGTYVEGDYYNNPQQKQTLAEAAQEIQQLLSQLEKSYSTDTTMGKMALATEAIQHIDSNPSLHARILSALKVGSIKAFEQSLDHPAASFVIGALEDWQKSKQI